MTIPKIIRRVSIVTIVVMIAFASTSSEVVRAVSPPIPVTTTDVTNDENDGHCDLYEALQAIFSQKSTGTPIVTYHECTALAGVKNVIFEGTAAGGLISMPTGPGSLNLPMINDDVTITGPVILDGAEEKRIFSVAASGTLTLEGLTLQNGHTAGGGGAILSSQSGKVNILFS